MATQNQHMPIGQWVQYNAPKQSKRAGKPTAIEQTIGMVRASYNAQGNTMYQVVWNPGSMQPATALYKEEQLVPIDQDKANEVAGEMNAGTYTPSMGAPGSEYVQPNIPTQALPPSAQATGQRYTSDDSVMPPTTEG